MRGKVSGSLTMIDCLFVWYLWKRSLSPRDERDVRAEQELEQYPRCLWRGTAGDALDPQTQPLALTLTSSFTNARETPFGILLRRAMHLKRLRSPRRERESEKKNMHPERLHSIPDHRAWPWRPPPLDAKPLMSLTKLHGLAFHAVSFRKRAGRIKSARPRHS